jgi:uncharacterized protein (TIGR02453 family)
MADAAFVGFPKSGLTFLRDLHRNNERPWFNARKETYLSDVSEPLRALAYDLASRLRAAKIPLAPNPRKTAFRIYRDVRFSNDKRPYKTWASFVFHPGGDPAEAGVLYVHVDPKEPFVAAGFYHPEKEALAALRGAIVSEPRAFLRLARTLEANDATLMSDETLVRMPPAFRDATGTEIEPFVKLTSIVARRALAPALLEKPALVDAIVDFARATKPLVTWGSKALQTHASTTDTVRSARTGSTARVPDRDIPARGATPDRS